jgi:hypothetical protein
VGNCPKYEHQKERRVLNILGATFSVFSLWFLRSDAIEDTLGNSSQRGN